MARQSKSSGSGGKTPTKAMAAAGGADTKGVETDSPVKTKTSIPQFISQVRQETSKVTWPTTKETWITSVMVFIMVTIAAIFFFLADTIISTVLQLVLKDSG